MSRSALYLPQSQSAIALSPPIPKAIALTLVTSAIAPKNSTTHQ
ncbi:hypothetical protein [Argonema galeatum]|nr:hypothetical protein [Argonema galeatum]